MRLNLQKNISIFKPRIERHNAYEKCIPQRWLVQLIPKGFKYIDGLLCDWSCLRQTAKDNVTQKMPLLTHLHLKKVDFMFKHLGNPLGNPGNPLLSTCRSDPFIS